VGRVAAVARAGLNGYPPGRPGIKQKGGAMPNHVVNGAMMTCTFGSMPATFGVLPHTVVSANMPVGVITDNKPFVNIKPFGPCKSLAFPATASATAAALGALTPMPCVPNTPAPWVLGAPTVLVNNMPALNDTACLTCIWGGMIRFTSAGQFQETIP
jgi:hypothetical protein